MAKTSAGDLRAIVEWQKANPEAMRKAHHKYEVAHYRERKAKKAEWKALNRLRYVNGIGRARGLQMLRDQERMAKEAQKR